MNFLDAFWHLANWLAPALGVGLLTPLMAKWVWRSRLRARPYWSLATWALAAALACSLVNLLLLDRDGRLFGYANLVIAVAGALWWTGFGARVTGRR